MHKKMAQSQLVKYERVFPIEYMGENEATVDDLIGKWKILILSLLLFFRLAAGSAGNV